MAVAIGSMAEQGSTKSMTSGIDPIATDKIEEILWTLSEKTSIKFHNLFDHAATRAEIVATFLALLELIRLKQVRAQQSAHFGEIEIVKAAV